MDPQEPAPAGLHARVVELENEVVRLNQALAADELILRDLAAAPLAIVEIEQRGECGLCGNVVPAHIDRWDELDWHLQSCPYRLAKERFL